MVDLSLSDARTADSRANLRMHFTTSAERRALETLGRADLEARQLQRLNQLLDSILPANALYAEKLAGIRRPVSSCDDFRRLPFTYKEGLQAKGRDGRPSQNLTYPVDHYVRYHQTSGTRGRPLVVLDTADDWQWWLDVWQHVLDAAEITANDRVMMAFSFGPFIGFWSAHDACIHRGALVIPGGGLSTLARLELIRNSQATVVFSTPSYALHMAEVAQQHQIDVADFPVRVVVLAGEPGASIAATRQRIEQAWNARIFDHAGSSEVGPWGYADTKNVGLHVNEADFIAEFLSAKTGGPAGEGDLSELVLTSLGRPGFPVIRYRTGDLVRPCWQHDRANRFVLLEGGVLGRTDDMVIIRGVNVYPSAIEQILRSFPEVHEFRIVASREAEMDQLAIEIEDGLNQPERVADELQLRLNLRVGVSTVPLGSLPRFEGKGKRFVDRRGK